MLVPIADTALFTSKPDFLANATLESHMGVQSKQLLPPTFQISQYQKKIQQTTQPHADGQGSPSHWVDNVKVKKQTNETEN